MVPVMDQRVAKEKYYLDSSSHYRLSVLCYGCVDKLLPHNLTCISAVTPAQSAH